jgi:ribosomal protein S18 acetylase RimI-like enzyme
VVTVATHELVHRGDERIRLGPWRTHGTVAYVSPVPAGPPPRSETVRRAVEVARERGFRALVTAALAPHETGAFLDAGFEPREELVLLAHDLRSIPDVDTSALRRARRGDRPTVLRIDAAAFDSFWTMDEIGLADAVAATPSSRYRVAEDGGRVVGYAVHGRSGSGGYVQRVAVDPAAHGRGLGAALVVDGLRWMRRRGCLRAVVNTQKANERAQSLYRRLGFVREPHGLHVLQLSLDGTTLPG